MRTAVTVELDDILSLIHCAQDYGHGNAVFMDAMAGMLGRELSDDEILAYADDYITPESRSRGYSEEDRASAIEALREFKVRFIGGECGVAVPEEGDAPESEDGDLGVSPAERARILAEDWRFVDRE